MMFTGLSTGLSTAAPRLGRAACLLGAVAFLSLCPALSGAQALLVETAFYLGYFTIALPAGLYMEKHSYKRGILLGLILYAVGALLFIPAVKAPLF